jgi:hypothetical protein
MSIDLNVANDLAQQLMDEIDRIQEVADAQPDEWMSALMQLTASIVVMGYDMPVSTRAILDIFERYVERAQQGRLAQERPNA